MTCEACGLANAAGARFCCHCGQALQACCAGCGAELPDSARYCPTCGQAVPAPPKDRPSALVPATERKQVTVLFGDFSGFTAFSSKLDAEDVRDQMAAVWERLDAVLTAHGGVVEKHRGDDVMAMFGARRAREDDPAQAVNAALAVQECLAAGAREKTLPSLQMRIGIHTGLVVVGPLGPSGELAGTGDTINVASRIETAAPPGGILISRDTYRQVYGLFHVQEMAPQVVRGKSEPLQTYLVLRAKPRGIALQQRGVPDVETELIGRDAELKRLQAALRSVLEDRSLQALTIVGEAGIGKSRLLGEFLKWVDPLPERLRLFFGRATAEMTGLPFSVIRNAFFLRFEIQESDSAAVAREKLEKGLMDLLRASHEALASTPDELAMMAHFIGQLLGLDFSDRPSLRGILNDPEQIRHRAFHYLTRFFTAVGEEPASAPGRRGIRAALLVLEDAHLCDDGSLDLVAHLARTCQSAPMMIVCLAREALFERRPAWGEGLAAHTRLNLEPLSPREGRALVESILRRAPKVPRELLELIVGGAEGNPFYIEELIKMLMDQGVIVPGPGAWRIEPGQFVEARVPPTLAGVLQARVDGLSPLERAVLQRASVVGRVFWESAVERLSSAAELRPVGGVTAEGTLTRAQVSDALNGLRRKELIFRRESSAFADVAEYIFKHELLRNVAYEGVLKKLRRSYHAQVAAWLVEQSGERISDFTGLVAAHFERAGRAADAAEWYGRAGQQARKGYTPGTAGQYLRKALELLPAEHDGQARSWRFEWSEGLGEVLTSDARFDEALEAYAQTRSFAEALKSPLAQARAWNGLAFLHERRGDNRASIEAAEQAAAFALQAGDEGRAEQIKALNLKGWAYYRLGDAAEVLALGAQTLKLCTDFGDRPGLATSLKLHGVAHLLLGHFAEADSFFEQGLAVCQECGDRRNAAAMWSNLGESARLRGDYEAAVELYQKALAIARQIGRRESELIYMSNLAGARLGLRQFKLAEEVLREAIALTGTDKSGTLSEAHSFLAEACLGQEKFAEALEAAQRALEFAQASESHLDLGGAWRTLGRAVAAAKLAAKSPATAGAGAAIHDPDACFGESLRVFRLINAEGEQACTLLAWGETELRRGQPEAARQHLVEARAVFLRLGMMPEVQKADALL